MDVDPLRFDMLTEIGRDAGLDEDNGDENEKMDMHDIPVIATTFVTISEEDIQQRLDNTSNENKKKATKVGIHVFRAFTTDGR